MNLRGEMCSNLAVLHLPAQEYIDTRHLLEGGYHRLSSHLLARCNIVRSGRILSRREFVRRKRKSIFLEWSDTSHVGD